MAGGPDGSGRDGHRRVVVAAEGGEQSRPVRIGLAACRSSERCGSQATRRAAARRQRRSAKTLGGPMRRVGSPRKSMHALSVCWGMARPLRFLPPGSLVEVTMRTVHGRLLLRPSSQLNDLVLGVIGRAQRKYAMRIHALAVLGNHHALLSPDSPQQLAAFMDYLASNIAREIGKLYDWREKFWARRYRSILVSDEEEAQVGRLAYLLGNGVKEGLVAKPQDWPG
ncbi:MAG TPA: transposase, partial [Thermoanaerobaculia bacterium]|nr:transposase [Thermoanaerobaculia bacterium]